MKEAEKLFIPIKAEHICSYSTSPMTNRLLINIFIVIFMREQKAWNHYVGVTIRHIIVVSVNSFFPLFYPACKITLTEHQHVMIKPTHFVYHWRRVSVRPLVVIRHSTVFLAPRCSPFQVRIISIGQSQHCTLIQLFTHTDTTWCHQIIHLFPI